MNKDNIQNSDRIVIYTRNLMKQFPGTKDNNELISSLENLLKTVILKYNLDLDIIEIPEPSLLDHKITDDRSDYEITELEKLYDDRYIGKLGVSEFNMNRLKKLIDATKNLCSVSRELIEFGKKNDVELLTHSDSDENFHKIIKGYTDSMKKATTDKVLDGSDENEYVPQWDDPNLKEINWSNNRKDLIIGGSLSSCSSFELSSGPSHSSPSSSTSNISHNEPKIWTLNNFDIGCGLGKGQLGRVYLAREKTSGYIVALKVIKYKKMNKDNIQNSDRIVIYTRNLMKQFPGTKDNNELISSLENLLKTVILKYNLDLDIIEIPEPSLLDHKITDDRSDYEITAKLFLLTSEKSFISQSLYYLFRLLGINYLDTLIIHFHGLLYTDKDQLVGEDGKDGKDEKDEKIEDENTENKEENKSI
ncbi:12192_t:CDS:10 [Entrophospora sp. SA101]|nr:12192_t:CDS:10 [Entrophospora sp. SA101]